MWTKSACVVLAWGMLLTLMVAGMGGSAPRTQANMRIASSTTAVSLTSTVDATTASTTTAQPAPRYVVQPGDSLSSIAVARAVRGGWQALYAANRRVIGPDPDVIHPGTALVLPGQMTPVSYTVRTGDTLSGIATEFAIPGGWPTLYAGNRRVIGPDPNVIRPGTVLTLVRPAAPTRPSSRPAHHRQAKPAPPATHAAPSHHAPQTRTSAPATAGMPGWLRIMLLAAGLLIGTAFLGELVLAIARRRRQASARNAQPETTSPRESSEVEPLITQEAHIVLADFDRLVVTHNKADDTICVLRPPGEDPRAILRVARLVLPEDPYEELAEQLGVPASWPME
ncbi:MAG: LysM domain-containing protein [Trebonia sp.]